MAACTAALLKARSGQFDVEDIRRLELAGAVALPIVAGSALAAAVNLEALDVRRCGIKSLEGMEALTALVRLDARDNGISALGPLARLPCLAELHLSGNAITDARQLEVLRELAGTLRVLSLGTGRGNPVTVGDRHIPILLDLLPGLAVLDDVPVPLLKVRPCLAAAAAATTVKRSSTNTTNPNPHPRAGHAGRVDRHDSARRCQAANAAVLPVGFHRGAAGSGARCPWRRRGGGGGGVRQGNRRGSACTGGSPHRR